MELPFGLRVLLEIIDSYLVYMTTWGRDAIIDQAQYSKRNKPTVNKSSSAEAITIHLLIWRGTLKQTPLIPWGGENPG